MTVESATYISDFVPSNTGDSTALSEGGQQIALVKTVLQTTMPNVSGAITASHTELNYCDITTLGTAQSSKAITVDASANCDCSAVTFTDLGTVTTADINGGSIDGATIGTNSAAVGTFTILTASNSAVLSSAEVRGALGFGISAGGTVTQATSRTTGVEINKQCGTITLVSAAGSTSWQTFTVTNSEVSAIDSVIVTQRSGTDKYLIHVTNVSNGSFDITFATTAGTTTEQPIFNFAIIGGSTI